MALTNKINGIHRYGDNIYASSRAYCPGGDTYPLAWAADGVTPPFFNYIFQRNLLGSYYLMDYCLMNNKRPKFADFQKFTFIIDGESKRAYVDDEGYEWGVKNPSIGPALTAGALGNPNGTYQCYVTFYIGFPNDRWVETGPSPVSEITVTSDIIEWSGIPISNYVGDYLIIHRKLYRTVSGVAYLVTELTNNSVSTYSDDVTDATLQLSPLLGTANYTTPPTGQNVIDIAIYLQRVFLIKDNRLYWSEPYLPFSFNITSDAVITKQENENLIGIINWGDQLYMASTEEWYRLQGSDPNTWAIRRTHSDTGIINRDTLKKTRYGLIYLWNDGIYVFDGDVSKNLTDKILGKKFFTELDDLTNCYAEFDGMKYWFYYASSGSTVDSCFILDFSFYPDLRIYHDNFVAHAHEFYKETNHHYLARDGYEWTDGETETIPTLLTTGDKGFGNINRRKCLDYVYYDINTAGQDVSVEILVDGVSVQTLTLNTSSRQRKRSDKLKSIEGYRFGLQISCADSQNVLIYAPWTLEATPVGE